MAWAFTKAFFRAGRAPSESLVEDASEFELPTIPTDINPSSNTSSAFRNGPNATRSILQRLGAGLSGRKAAVTASVEFDASDFSGSESGPVSPTASSLFSRVSPATSTESLLSVSGSSEPGVPQSMPRKSALSFLNRVSEQGLSNAIGYELWARQDQKVRDFANDMRIHGIRAARARAEGKMAGDGFTGRTDSMNVQELAKNGLPNAGSLDASSAFQAIQSRLHGAEKGPNLSSREIADNFTKNGGGLEAAEIALAYLEASHDYIQANEDCAPVQGQGRNFATASAEEKDASRQQISPSLYDNRDRSLCR